MALVSSPSPMIFSLYGEANFSEIIFHFQPPFLYQCNSPQAQSASYVFLLLRLKVPIVILDRS